MIKFLKFLGYALLAAVALCGAAYVAMIFWFLFGGAAISCGEDSESVAYARGLSDERLTRLYHDMEKFSLDPDTPYSDLLKDSKGLFQEPFSDIKAARIRPKQENIMLDGCFDHYVILYFHGLEANKQYNPKRQIVLTWGEHDGAGSEVIWSE